MSSFPKFQKIPRYNRECIVTEKIDGTNALVHIERYIDDRLVPNDMPYTRCWWDGIEYLIAAGSRSRWIKPGDDNFAFACWVWSNKDELVKLGEGSHHGEWWGRGIQRGYGIDEKRFSLFNTTRWNDENKPECCHVVPVLWRGLFEDLIVDNYMWDLKHLGSAAAPGFMKPEGIIIYHVAANTFFKKTLEKDSEPKGKNT